MWLEMCLICGDKPEFLLSVRRQKIIKKRVWFESIGGQYCFTCLNGYYKIKPAKKARAAK